MGGKTRDNESAVSAPKEWSLLSPLPHPLQGTELNPSDSPGTPLSTMARTGKEGRRNCFCVLWALLLLGPFHLLCPTLAHPLHNWVPTECQELCLSLGVSKRVRQLLLSKSLLSRGNEDTREGCNNLLCSNWVPSASLEWGGLVSSVVSDCLQPTDCSLPGSFVHGILQARILEWVAMPSSRESYWPRDGTKTLISPALTGRFFTTSATREDMDNSGTVTWIKLTQRVWQVPELYWNSSLDTGK